MFTFQACGKINLGLKVTERRPDGYHNLQTVFYPIPLCDEIWVEEALSDQLTLTGIPIEGASQDNLVLRAVRMMRERGFSIPPLNIRLHKNIPNGAGLGGGSSDAAGMVRTLNKHYALGLTESEMEQAVSTLGADCPFFVRCQPVYAQGIGDVFSPVEVNLSGMYLVLVKPAESVSTREAYALIRPHMPKIPLNQLITQPIETWRDAVTNDFEDSVFPNHPAIRDVKNRLYSLGATYACMSGSGSSVFGLFPQKPNTAGLFEGTFLHETQL